MEACPRCGRENEADAVFCSRCGLELATVQRNPTEGETWPCYRHPKQMTTLRCGKCERPICTKCTIIGPAGQRCPDCSKMNVPMRPQAIGYTIKRGFRDLWANPYRLWIMILIVSMVGGLLRGCSSFRAQTRPVQISNADSSRDE